MTVGKSAEAMRRAAYPVSLDDVRAAEKRIRPFIEIMKLAADHDGETYRATYVVFPEVVYVLHVFHKKSKRGVATPRADKRRIDLRFGSAHEHHSRNYPHTG